VAADGVTTIEFEKLLREEGEQEIFDEAGVTTTLVFAVSRCTPLFFTVLVPLLAILCFFGFFDLVRFYR